MSAIAVQDRLIFALDVPAAGEARELIARLGDAVSFYKLGLEIFMSGAGFDLLDELTRAGKKVFVDLKFFDVPQTVASAVSQLRGRGVTFTTVHGNDAILQAACAAAGEVQILAVTALTSLDRHDMEDLGFHTDLSALVLSRARRARDLGCTGVIASGQEAARLRRELGPDLRIVIPGIRPRERTTADDQKRTVDVEEAFHNGADHIVVGRPIRQAADPHAAAAAIQTRIAALFP